MGLRRGWAHALAAVAVALFVLGLVYAISPPEPDCGEGIAVYCQQDAYDRVRFTILGSWIAGIVLLGGATWILFYVRKNPPAERAPRPSRAARVPDRTVDGRRVVNASRPPFPGPGPSSARPANGRAAPADPAPRPGASPVSTDAKTPESSSRRQARDEVERENT